MALFERGDRESLSSTIPLLITHVPLLLHAEREPVSATMFDSDASPSLARPVARTSSTASTVMGDGSEASSVSDGEGEGDVSSLTDNDSDDLSSLQSSLKRARYSSLDYHDHSHSSEHHCQCHESSTATMTTTFINANSLNVASALPLSFSECRRGCCSLTSALASLRKNDKMADVCFTLTNTDTNNGSGAQTIYAHRMMLAARSPVFDRMFNGQCYEAVHYHSSISHVSHSSTIITIDIPDITPQAFAALLDYIYEDKIPVITSDYHSIDPFHLPSLLYAASKYDLPRLLGACRTALHRVSPRHAIQLWQLLQAINEEALADQYHTYILRHATSILGSDGFLLLNQALLVQLIKDDRLQVTELHLFHSLRKWCNNRCERSNLSVSVSLGEECKESPYVSDSDKDSDQMMRDWFLPHIRFPLMNARDLALHVAPTGLLSDCELKELFVHINSDRTAPLAATVTRWVGRSRVACPRSVSLAYHWDGDDYGLIHWLGSSENKSPFINPALNGECLVTASSVQFGSTHALTSRSRTVQFWTHSRSSQWLCLDIDPTQSGRSLVPSHLTLQHGYDRPVDCLANWTLEASTGDWNEWDQLLTRVAAPSFNSGHQLRTWALPSNIVKAYRLFRIRSLGLDSSERTEFMCVGGIELYGELQLMTDELRLTQEMQQQEKKSSEIFITGPATSGDGGSTTNRPINNVAVMHDHAHGVGDEPMPLNNHPINAAADGGTARPRDRREERCWRAARHVCTIM